MFTDTVLKVKLCEKVVEVVQFEMHLGDKLCNDIYNHDIEGLNFLSA